MDGGTFGRFRDLLPLGEGGMGQVFLARAVGPGGFVKPVVLKRMHVALAKVPELVERFLREARVQAQLVCPNIVQVLDFGRMDDTYFLVLEYVHGVDLGVLMRASKEPLPAGVVVRIALDACRGLEYAHRARDAGGAPLGLVHRDVSPPNVLVSYEGDSKLGDFGLVQSSTGEAGRTVGVMYGKPAYMSPEQARGAGVDARCDQFALGTVTYFLSTGVEPFRAATRAETVARVLAASPEPIEQLRPDLPPAFAAVVKRAMQPRPEDRFTDAAEMLTELESVAVELGAAASTRAVRDRVRALFPGAAEQDPWSSDARTQQLELQRLVAEDGVTVLTVAEPGKPAPPARRRPRWPWYAAAALVVLLGASIGPNWGRTSQAHRSPRARVARESSPPVSAPPRSVSDAAVEVAPVQESPRTQPTQRVRAATRRSGESGKMGRLRVGVTPGWGWVWVDGRRVGTTPIDVEVEEGVRRVRIVAGSGREQEQVVRVEKGATRSVFVESFE